MGGGSAYRHLPGFLDPDRVVCLRRSLEEAGQAFERTDGSRGLGPRYEVLRGEAVRSLLPEVEALARDDRLTRVVAELAGSAVRPMVDPSRCLRVQRYVDSGDSFRWHFDGNSYAVILTLRNENGGATEIVGPGLSRWVRPLLYAFYPFPGLFDRLPCARIECAPGDLLVLAGGRCLHRGRPGRHRGRREIVVAGFDEAGKRPRPLRDRIARRLNYRSRAV